MERALTIDENTTVGEDHHEYNLFGSLGASASSSSSVGMSAPGKLPDVDEDRHLSDLLEAPEKPPPPVNDPAPEVLPPPQVLAPPAKIPVVDKLPPTEEDHDLFGVSASSSFKSVPEIPIQPTDKPAVEKPTPTHDDHHQYDLFGPSTASSSLATTESTVSLSEKKVGEEEFELFPSTAEVSVAQTAEIISHPAPLRAETRSSALPPAYKQSGNAVDIIAVRSTTDEYYTTPWHVSFSWSRFRSSWYTGVGDMVKIFVNGKELPTKMQLLERGRCVFITGGLTPPLIELNYVNLSDKHPNHVRFEHYQKSTDTVRYVDGRLHVWGPNESIVVVDLDGTLTISDVEGHIRTIRLGQYDFLHAGACDFFSKLHELDMRIVYLTARPIDWATASRTHLENAKQQTRSLPPGPLITNSNGLTGALMTEVVNKNPHIFKAQVLNEIQLTLIHAGRVTEHPVFVAGFGNRPTDIVAYEQVGMDPSLIFMLDTYSNLKASSDPRIYESYSDPNALLWLLPRLKHRVPIEKVGKIDDYTVRELVLAEDREQLLMAERQARRMQEEEYARARQTSDRISAYHGSF